MPKHELFTIGHSKLSIEEFVKLIILHSIQVVCDVRSSPYSRYNPQFNKELLSKTLLEHQIKYLYMGDSLGGRGSTSSDFINGKISYQRICSSRRFLRGIERIRRGVKEYRIVLMCAEKDPLRCHRSILITRYLRNDQLTISHIHSDGSLENNADLERRLVRMHNLPEQDLFLSGEDILGMAYDLQGDRIAYSRSDKNAPESYTASEIHE